MSAFSNHLETGLLNHTLRGAALAAPSGVFLALFTSDPTDAGTGDELTDSAYSRQDIAGGDAIATGWTEPDVYDNGTDPVGHAVTNAKLITFPPIEDTTVTVTHYGIYDAATGGNLLYHGEFAVAQTLAVNDVMSVAVGGLTVVLR